MMFLTGLIIGLVAGVVITFAFFTFVGMASYATRKNHPKP